MKKSLTFYTELEWENNFNKGNGWTYYTEFPPLYVNREHAKNNNLRDYRESKKDFWKTIKKIKITIEDL